MDKCDLTYVLQEQSGCCINHWGARAEAGRLREGSCSCLDFLGVPPLLTAHATRTGAAEKGTTSGGK